MEERLNLECRVGREFGESMERHIKSAIIAGLINVGSLSDFLTNQYVSSGSKAIASIALYYTAMRDYVEDEPYAKGMLVAGGGLCAAGITELLSGMNEQKPISLLTVIVDLAISGILFRIYCTRTMNLRKAKINSGPGGI